MCANVRTCKLQVKTGSFNLQLGIQMALCFLSSLFYFFKFFIFYFFYLIDPQNYVYSCFMKRQIKPKPKDNTQFLAKYIFLEIGKILNRIL